MINVDDFINVIDLQAMDIGGKRVSDLKSILYYALKHNMIDTYDLTESAKLLNVAIANRCMDSEVKAKQIQGYAYGIEQYCSGKLYTDQKEPTEQDKIQARNAHTIVELTDEVLTGNQSI